MPAAANRAPHQLFISADSVHVGRIQKIDTQVDGAMNSGDGFGFVRRTVNSDMPMQPRPSAETTSFAAAQPALRHVCKTALASVAVIYSRGLQLEPAPDARIM